MSILLRNLRFLISLTLGSVITLSVAADPLTIPQQQALIRNVLAAKTSARDSHFQRWVYTTAVLEMSSCLRQDKTIDLRKKMDELGVSANDIKELLKGPSQVTGTYTYVTGKAQEKICTMLAEEGVRPYCTSGTPVTDYRLHHLKTSTWPIEYVVLKSQEESTVNFTLKCSVTSKKTRSTSGVTIDAIPKQTYIVIKEEIKDISGQGLTGWRWNAKNELLLKATKLSGSTPFIGNMVITTTFWETPFIWSLAIDP